jgi:hypothetical protein
METHMGPTTRPTRRTSWNEVRQPTTPAEAMAALALADAAIADLRTVIAERTADGVDTANLNRVLGKWHLKRAELVYAQARLAEGGSPLSDERDALAARVRELKSRVYELENGPRGLSPEGEADLRRQNEDLRSKLSRQREHYEREMAGLRARVEGVSEGRAA